MKKVVLSLLAIIVIMTGCKKVDVLGGPYTIKGRLYNGTTQKGYANIKLSLINTKAGDRFMGTPDYTENMGDIYTNNEGYFEFTYSRRDQGSSINTEFKDQYLSFPLNQNSTKDICVSDSATLIIHLHSNNPLTANDSFYVKTADKLIGLKGPLPVDYTLRMRQIPRPSAVWSALEFYWARSYKEFLNDYIKGVRNYQYYSVEGDPAINEYTINY